MTRRERESLLALLGILLIPFAVFASINFLVWWLSAPIGLIGTLFWVAAILAALDNR
jgi:hypothetical protein